jgi:hypothetical protein
MLALFYKETSMILAVTGREQHLYLIATIVLNSGGGGAMYTSTCHLGLRLCAKTDNTHSLLDWSVPADSGFFKPDTRRCPFSTDVYLPHVNNNLKCESSYRNFAASKDTLLHKFLSVSSIVVAVASLNAAVKDAMEWVIARGCRGLSLNSLPGFPVP